MDIFKKPKNLPNITMPYGEVVSELINNNIHHNLISVAPFRLKPIRNIIVGVIDELNSSDSEPIYISDDYQVLDGHYKLANALLKNKPYIKVIKIGLNVDEASNILRNIQNYSEYKKKIKKANGLKPKKQADFFEKKNKRKNVI